MTTPTGPQNGPIATWLANHPRTVAALYWLIALAIIAAGIAVAAKVW